MKPLKLTAIPAEDFDPTLEKAAKACPTCGSDDGAEHVAGSALCTKLAVHRWQVVQTALRFVVDILAEASTNERVEPPLHERPFVPTQVVLDLRAFVRAAKKAEASLEDFRARVRRGEIPIAPPPLGRAEKANRRK